MPGIWDYLMTPPYIREGRKREEEQRKNREDIARRYGLPPPIKDTYISGEITLTQALSQIPEPQKQPTPSELLKEEGARKQLRVGGMMEKVLPGLIGAHGKEGFAKMAEPQVGRPTLETLGILPPKPKVEKAKATYKPSEKEKLSRYLVLAEQGQLTNPQHRKIVEIAGYDPDTGEKVEKEGIYPPEVGTKRKQAMSILKDLEEKRDELSPGEQVLREATEAYLDSTMGKYGAAGFVGEKAKPPDKFYEWVETQNPDEIDWQKIKAKHPDWDLSDFGQ